MAEDKSKLFKVGETAANTLDTGIAAGRAVGGAAIKGAAAIADNLVLTDEKQKKIGEAVKGGVDSAKKAWQNWTTKKAVPKVD